MNDELKVLVVQRGDLRHPELLALREAGLLVIESSEPETVRLLTPTAILPAEDMFACALAALDSDGHTDAGHKQRALFVRLMLKALNKRQLVTMEATQP